MGGYGAWLIAGKTAETWAALGLKRVPFGIIITI
jgi:hypothetical protein